MSKVHMIRRGARYRLKDIYTTMESRRISVLSQRIFGKEAGCCDQQTLVKRRRIYCRLDEE